MIDASKEKLCNKCGKVKPLSAMAKRYETETITYRAECLDCHHARVSAYHKANPEKTTKWYRQKASSGNDKWRNRQFKNKDAHDAYLKLFEAQGGVCAICGKPETSKHRNGTVRSLALDHDHKTGEFRGVLCFRCNTTLAELEKEDFISKAQAYLAKERPN